jgi:hypothetical protein
MGVPGVREEGAMGIPATMDTCSTWHAAANDPPAAGVACGHDHVQYSIRAGVPWRCNRTNQRGIRADATERPQPDLHTCDHTLVVPERHPVPKRTQYRT